MEKQFKGEVATPCPHPKVVICISGIESQKAAFDVQLSLEFLHKLL